MKSRLAELASLLVSAGVCMGVVACSVFEAPLVRDDAGDAGDAGGAGDAGVLDPDASALDAGADASSADAGAIVDAGSDAGVAIPRRPALASCGFGAPVTTGTITNATLDEISGLAVSRENAGIVWVVEDSGSAAVVHAIDLAGQLLATYGVGGAAIDYEDLAIGPGPTPGVDYLYVADIGSNDGMRTSITVYRAPEPVVVLGQAFVSGALAAVEPLPMVYPAGLHDNAEAIFVDPITSDLYLVTKNGFVRPNRLLRLAAPQQPAVVRTLELLGSVYAGDSNDIAVTGADVSADGMRVVIRSLHAANVFTRAPGATIADTVLASTPCAGPIASAETKGESIGFATDGYFTTSEGASQGLHFVSFVP